MGQNLKLCVSFMWTTKKYSSTNIIWSVPYWVHNFVPQNLNIFLLAVDVCNLEDYGYFISWCKFHIDIYDCFKFSISMVSANYKVNWHFSFFHIRWDSSNVRINSECLYHNLINSFSKPFSFSYSYFPYSISMCCTPGYGIHMG